MAYEVDFLAVGDGEKSGDAIALRFGNLSGDRSQQTVYVIDGGTKESGETLVEHIKKYYKTDYVDGVFLTHPDADHSSGLTVVLEKLKVGILFMHQPWNHAEDIRHMFDDERVTPSGLEERTWRALQNARELEKLADSKNIKIVEPFSDDLKEVLGPSKAFYQEQLTKFRCMPECAEEPGAGLFAALKAAASAVAKWAYETWQCETLTEPDENATSAENNSSLILRLEIDGESLLFTGDAGVPALQQAINRAIALGIDLKTAKLIQVPHHGSKRNVGPEVLNSIVGPRQNTESYNKTACVSASKESPKHPAKKVVNAFKRRGARVYATQGQSLWHHSHDAPSRAWGAAAELPFYQQVEE